MYVHFGKVNEETHLYTVSLSFSLSLSALSANRIEGRSVLDYIIDKDVLLESLVMDICRKLIEGVAYLHGMGVAHLDVHPENILAVEHGVAPNIKLVGFGNAEYIGPDRPTCLLDLNRVNVEFSGECFVSWAKYQELTIALIYFQIVVFVETALMEIALLCLSAPLPILWPSYHI